MKRIISLGLVCFLLLATMITAVPAFAADFDAYAANIAANYDTIEGVADGSGLQMDNEHVSLFNINLGTKLRYNGVNFGEKSSKELSLRMRPHAINDTYSVIIYAVGEDDALSEVGRWVPATGLTDPGVHTNYSVALTETFTGVHDFVFQFGEDTATANGIFFSEFSFVEYVTQDPYTAIKANTHSNDLGGAINNALEDTAAGVTGGVGALGSNEALIYKNLDFGETGADAFRLHYRSVSQAFGTEAGVADNLMYVRLDGLEGELLATFDLATVQFAAWQNVTVDTPNLITGVHDLYIIAPNAGETQVHEFAFSEYVPRNPYDKNLLVDVADSYTSCAPNTEGGEGQASFFENFKASTIISRNHVFGDSAAADAVLLTYKRVENPATDNDPANTITIHLDAADGVEIASFDTYDVPFNTWLEVYAPLSQEIVGEHDLYFVGPSGVNTVVSAFQFVNTEEYFDSAYDTIAAVDFDISGPGGENSTDAANTESPFIGWFNSINGTANRGYTNLNFGDTGASYVKLRLIKQGATDANDSADYMFNVYIDGMDGDVVAALDMHDIPTSTWMDVILPLNQTVTGVRDVYIEAAKVESSFKSFEFLTADEVPAKDGSYIAAASRDFSTPGHDERDQTLGWFQNGISATYMNVQLGEEEMKTVTVAVSDLTNAAATTGTLEIRKNDRNGDLLATFQVADLAAGWNELEAELSTPLSGTQTICVVSTMTGGCPGFAYMKFEPEKIYGFTAEAEVANGVSVVVPKAYVTMHDDVDPADSVTAFCAFYDADGRLITYTASGTLPASNMTKGEAATLEMAPVDIAHWNNAASVRVFVWDSLDGMKPQVPAIDITKEF